MTSSLLTQNKNSTPDENIPFFEAVAQALLKKGFGVYPSALPENLAALLWRHVQNMPADQFKKAGVGRDYRHGLDDAVRTDEVCWISDDSAAGKAWLEWVTELQNFLNRRLLLGLFSFESHFAHYAPGDFYKRHLDAFKGESNRVLSLVLYLNPDWQPEDGGELVIQLSESEQDVVKVSPDFVTLVVFLSEEFPHEVLPANRDRYSIAGWYRLNTSSTERADPPS